MQLQKLAALAAFLASSAYAHSWLECVDTDVSNYDAAKADPTLTVEQTCNGYPRNKEYNGDWISESSYYSWNLDNDGNDGYTCNGMQRDSTYTSSAPMARATPGQTLRMRFWGNGHSKWNAGSPLHRDPGLVRVYWAGQKEIELSSKSNLTQANWLPGAQGNFSADAVIEMLDGTNMNEKANWYDLVLPEEIENGRHMMVWTWAWVRSFETNSGDYAEGDYNVEWRDQYTTCFDIEIENSSFSGINPTVAAAQASGTSDDSSDVCSTSCMRGGQSSSTCDGTTETCPPCWYISATDGSVSCYDYSSGSTCPFGGAYDCSTKSYDRRALRFDRGPM